MRGDQGKFWDYHDMLFDTGPEKMSAHSAPATAGLWRGVGPEEDEFRPCLTSQIRHQDGQDRAGGREVGLKPRHLLYQ